MTLGCSDCSTCGKCYPKDQLCPSCGEHIYMLDASCEHCGAPITDEMRWNIRKAFMAERKKMRDEVLELARLEREKASQPNVAVVYPWDV